MSDKPLDFDSVIRWLSRGDPLPYEPSAIAILRAATGLTLAEALARLKGGATELYPSTWPTPNNIPSAETGQNVGGIGVQNVTSPRSNLVSVRDVDMVLEEHYSRMIEGKCSRRWVLGEIAKLSAPAPATEPVVRLSDVDGILDAHVKRWDGAQGMASLSRKLHEASTTLPAPVVPPGMVSVEDVVEVVSRYQLLDDAQTDGLIDRIRSLAAPAQKEEDNG